MSIISSNEMFLLIGMCKPMTAWLLESGPGVLHVSTRRASEDSAQRTMSCGTVLEYCEQ